MTCWLRAVRYRHHEVVEHLLDTKVFKEDSSYALYAFHCSIIQKDLRSFAILVGYGVDLREVDHLLTVDNKDWLMYAAEHSVRSDELIRIIEQIPSSSLFGWLPPKPLRYNRSCFPDSTPRSLWIDPSGYDTYSSVSHASVLVPHTIKPYGRTGTTVKRQHERTEITLKRQRSPSKDPTHCPITARIKARERLALRTRLRENFVRMHSEFLDRCSSPDASSRLSTFVEEMGTAQRIWKKGFESIRRLLNNQLPSSLQEVFSCVQISCSMRSCLDETTFSENAEANDGFLTDLDRWRYMVPCYDQCVYDEISRVAWGKSGEMTPLYTDWRKEQDTLQYFQKLMTSLIS